MLKELITDVNFFEDSEVRLVKSNCDDDAVALAAWVSTYGLEADERLSNRPKVEGLINYLMRENHETPFENAGSLTFYIKTPIFVAREFFRHRIGWSYNEISGRYAQFEPNFYLPPVTRPVIQTGKVGNYTFEPGEDDIQIVLSRTAVMENSQEAWVRYMTLKEAGVANEVARMVLPVNLMTEFIATCNPRSLMHFLGLRTAPNALLEIRSVANQMEKLWQPTMPITHEAYATARWSYLQDGDEE